MCSTAGGHILVKENTINVFGAKFTYILNSKRNAYLHTWYIV